MVYGFCRSHGWRVLLHVVVHGVQFATEANVSLKPQI